MKSKKLLSGLMALSIIATSSIALGTSAKAATPNAKSSTTLKAQGTSLDISVDSSGWASWMKVTNASRYQITLKTSTGGFIKGLGGGSDYLQQGISSWVPASGTYALEVVASDSNNKILADETIRFNYYHGVFSKY